MSGLRKDMQLTVVLSIEIEDTLGYQNDNRLFVNSDLNLALTNVH